VEQIKALNFLGLTNKAGKLVSGNENVINAIQKHKVYLVIIAVDASENTKKKAVDKCIFYNVPYKICFNSEQIGHSIGKESRMLVAITDNGFSNRLKDIE